MCFNLFKIAFLFVGSVIGAGFATGAEVILYFRNCNVWSVITAGVIIGLLAFAFSISYKIFDKFKFLKILNNITIYIASIITFIAMISGAEQIMRETFNIKYIGLISGLIIIWLSRNDIKSAKLLNFVVIPVILILIIIIASKSHIVRTEGIFSFKKSMLYASMNMVLSGYLMSEEGRKITAKQAFSMSIIVTVTITLLLLLVYYIAMQSPMSSMPIFEVSKGVQLIGVAGIIIYLAIISTLIGASSVVCKMTAGVTECKWIGILGLCVLSFTFYNAEFNQIVSKLYPLLGYMGLLLSGIVIKYMIYVIFRRILTHRRKVIN